MSSYKVTLPCTRAEAETLAALDFGDANMGPNAPVIVTSEIDTASPDRWEVAAYYSDKPKTNGINALRKFVPSASDEAVTVEKLADEDWTSLSQQGLEPIRAGRFHVHTPHMPADTSADVHNFCIAAGLAFGTGHHETTYGCLAMLDWMRRTGVRCDNMLDIGTGTGLLAFAAGHLWPWARLTASDIDPVCRQVVRENAARNNVRPGRSRGRLHMVIADGLDDIALARRAPYDLVTANILAGPLIDMADDIAGVVAPRGSLILAGLLNSQASDVLAAYRWQHMRIAARMVRGDWTIVWLRKRQR